MTDKLTEALEAYENWQRHEATSSSHIPGEGPIVDGAYRWRDFPTDNDIEKAEDAGWVHDENGDLTFDVRAALEAVKREDR